MTHPSVPILWSDSTAVAVNKPSGLLVHNSHWSGPREVVLLQLVRNALGHHVHPVHRLDRGTSGVVLFALDSSQAAQWQAALAQDQTHKDYLALVRGIVKDRVDIDHPVKDENGQRVEAHSAVTPLCVSPHERCCLVHVRLFTGRWHQARLHLKHLSHPIIGDANYGKGPLNRSFSATWGLSRLALHAWRLRVVHPMGSLVEVEAPLPSVLGEPLSRLLGEEGLEQALEQGRKIV